MNASVKYYGEIVTVKFEKEERLETLSTKCVLTKNVYSSSNNSPNPAGFHFDNLYAIS